MVKKIMKFMSEISECTLHVNGKYTLLT